MNREMDLEMVRELASQWVRDSEMVLDWALASQ